MKKSTRSRFLTVALFLVLVPFILAADRNQVKAIGEKLMCVCGCNQILIGCNHINCPNSVPMREEVAQYLDAGKDSDAIIAAFVEKYGPAVLSAPPTSGFSLSAWVMPFVALAIGGLAVVYFARHWKAPLPEAPAAAIDAQSKQRLEEELKNYTPED